MATVQDFCCILCKENFSTKEELQIHFRKHGDPKFNESLKNKSDETNTSEIAKDKAEMISCDVCPETFPTISKAITHKHKVHPDHDAKYFCPWCGKLFTMKHLYNRHVETSHHDVMISNEFKFHCDCCNVDFHVASAMVHHNKFFHRQDTDLPDIGQSKKQKLFCQELLLIYYCPFCGEEYNNKVNLHKHMVDDHSDENQSPQEVLRCSLCDAIFYHLDAYELHLTFHTLDDIYSESNEKLNIQEITDFSLESVPPVMERIENCLDSEFIENLLDADNGDTKNELILGKTKKKHKKHKKSKKSAITLDEFLNMNTDVFGEGLNFQGIEEVPTRAVAKQLKVKKQNPTKSASSGLEKLKKQGIVVKVKQSQKPGSSEDLKTENKIISSKLTKNLNSATETNLNVQKNPKVLTTSNEVLSKLLSQSNNQIKIVKKSSQDNNELLRSLSPENIEVTCDLIHNMDFSSDGETDNRRIENETENLTLKEASINRSTSSIHSTKDENVLQEKPVTSENIALEDTTNQSTIKNNELEGENKNKTSFNILKNVSQQITIKSMCESPNKVLNNTQSLETRKNDEEVSKGSESLFEERSASNSKKITEQSNADSSKCSLNALKSLSHLTVKPLSQSKSIEKIYKESEKNITIEKGNMQSSLDYEVSQEKLDNSQVNCEKDTTNSEVWKNICKKNITIKSLQEPIEQNREALENFSDMPNESDEDSNFDMDANKNQTKVLVKNNNLKTKLCDQNSSKNVYPLKNLGSGMNVIPPNYSPTMSNNTLPETQCKVKQICSGNESNNILKNLRNITAKPLGGIKPINNMNSSPCTNADKVNVIKKITKIQEEQDDIEIFNIDDSDSDEMATLESTKSDIKCKMGVIGSDKIDNKNDSMNSLNALRNISKSITIKSTKQQSTHTNKDIENKIPDSKKNDYDTDSDNCDVFNETLKAIEYKNSKPSNPLKVFKNLGKHITIKSNKFPTKQNQNEHINYDNDSDTFSDDQKITEMNDSDDEISLKHTTNKEPIVQFPSDSDSDHHKDCDEEIEDQSSDIESQIKINKLKNYNQKINQNPSNIEKLGTDIFKQGNVKMEPFIADESKPGSVKHKTINIPHNICKELSIKPLRQTTHQGESDTVANTLNNSNIDHLINRTTNQPLMNQNNSTVLNEKNILNKEVSVKTIQTETVIQEITTTVTKTIRTVNQTVQQERNINENSNTIKMQKIKQDLPPNKHIRSYQGMKIRHTTPNINQIRNAATIKQSSNSMARPSNQLVVRPTINPKLLNPKPPGTMKVAPSTSQQMPSVTGQKAIMGKPLKISPNVLNSPVKRPAQRESIGHFSCFKKPKESLIPVSDVPLSNQEESCATASYESSSNFSSTVSKTIKGNTSLMTQTKQVTCSSQQHLSKLNKISGLKIMKTSQKKVIQSEERCEVNAPKRTTLEAIEKLQKQGLLVKKPRVDMDDSDYNNSDDDTELYPTEENDK